MNENLKALLRGEIDAHEAQLFTTPHLSRIRNAAQALLDLLEEKNASPAADAHPDAAERIARIAHLAEDVAVNPILELIGSIRGAIDKYDATGDHCRHQSQSDCVRCNAAAAVYYSDSPKYHPPGSHERRQAEARQSERRARTGG